MKPSPKFIILSLIIVALGFAVLMIHTKTIRSSIDLRYKEIKLYVDKIEDYKKELKEKPDEVVTKADLAAFTKMNFYQSQINKLYMENDLDLSKGYPAIFPDYFLLILILLWLSFQLDKLDRRLQPVSIIKRFDENTLSSLKAESMKKKLEEEAKGDKTTST